MEKRKRALASAKSKGKERASVVQKQDHGDEESEVPYIEFGVAEVGLRLPKRDGGDS